LIEETLLVYSVLFRMQALLRASRRLDSARIAVVFSDSLPTLLGAVECLPSLSLIGLGRLHTADHSGASAGGGKPYTLIEPGILYPRYISKRQRNTQLFAVVPFNMAAAAAIRPGHPAVLTEEQQLMALKLRLTEQNVKLNRMLSPFSSTLLPSRHCGLIIESDNHVDDGAAENSNEWQADSVRRKRKKKMNKHKHSKRRKLTRHKR
jgi:hypothetical protein